MGTCSSGSNITVAPSTKGTKSYVDEEISCARISGCLSLSCSDISPSSDIWDRITYKGIEDVLQELDISGNTCLKILPKEILKFRNLKTLHASRCNLKDLIGLHSMRKLKTIKLDHNELCSDGTVTMLRTDVSFPSALINLDLSFNNFDVIPPAVFDLSLLTNLNLTNNNIHSIFGIGRLSSLKILVLDDNRLCELPEESSQLINLKEISLKRNEFQPFRTGIMQNLQSIPPNFFSKTKVEYIALDGNLQLTLADVMRFRGAEAFISRRSVLKRSYIEEAEAATNQSLLEINSYEV